MRDNLTNLNNTEDIDIICSKMNGKFSQIQLDTARVVINRMLKN